MNKPITILAMLVFSVLAFQPFQPFQGVAWAQVSSTATGSPAPAIPAPPAVPTGEPFSSRVLVSGLNSPWAMVWGPDDHLWVTERKGKQITRVNLKTGQTKVAVTIAEAFVGSPHEGLLGLALAPNFLQALQPGAENYVYVYYTYKTGPDNKQSEFSKIVRYSYNVKQEKLENPLIIIDGISAGNDHNGGRLIFGPDGKLYLSHGEQGHNQFGNFCKPIEAQRLPTAEEIKAKNYAAYAGKVLRLNPNGTIPADNPVLDGVRSHIFTYGHRNPQGLAFVENNLFSCEHGPSSDDEVNLLVAGGNYGWPHVAGFRDDQAYRYANYSAAPNCQDLAFDPNYIPQGVPIQNETDWNASNFKEPAKTFFTVPNGYNFNDERCSEMSYLCWPTMGPSSLAYYPADGPIVSWRNSLIVSTLKSGAIYRLPLNANKQHIQGDIIKLFHSQNRYRDLLISPDGRSIYVATDSSGQLRDMNGLPTKKIDNPGSIIVFTYSP